MEEKGEEGPHESDARDAAEETETDARITWKDEKDEKGLHESDAPRRSGRYGGTRPGNMGN